MQLDGSAIDRLDLVIDEAVRAEHRACRPHGAPARGEANAVARGTDALDGGSVAVAEAIGVRPPQELEHLLDQQAAVGAALAIGQDRPIAVVVDLEELSDRRLGHDLEQRRQLRRQVVQEVGVGRDPDPLGPQAPTLANEVVGEVHEHVVAIDHAHVPVEPLDPDAGAGLRDHQIEQVVGGIEVALALDREVGPELVRDRRERSFEVRRQLSGIATRGSARQPVSLQKEHGPRGVPQREECRRNPGDPGADDGHVDRGVRLEGPHRPERLELGDPGRSTGLVRVPGSVVGRDVGRHFGVSRGRQPSDRGSPASRPRPAPAPGSWNRGRGSWRPGRRATRRRR
jgi:hypothetical protein